MGCVQSQESLSSRKRAAKKMDPAAVLASSASAEASREENSAIAAAANANANGNPPVRDTAVLKQACVFDQLHVDAHTPPPLQQVTVNLGKRSSMLLQGFEEKEAAARARPQLIEVGGTDLAQSKLYDKLKGFEEKDARAAEEVRIDKGLMVKEGATSAVSGEGEGEGETSGAQVVQQVQAS